MKNVHLSLNWRGASLEFEYDRDQTTSAELADLIQQRTGIAPERMTLMVPNWKLKRFAGPSLPLTECTSAAEKVRGTLMGTPAGEEFVKKGVDDSSSSNGGGGRIRTRESTIEHGYANLGNTCYMNSVLALLENCTDFKDSLLSQNPPAASDVEGAWQRLWKLKERNSPANPQTLFSALISHYPNFATRSTNNPILNQQQDADECLMVLFNSLNQNRDWKQLFTFHLSQQLVGDDVETETSSVRLEKVMKLSCYPGTAMNPVSNMMAGIRVGFEETIEVDGVDRKRLTKLTECLPKYLIVHMVRFEWKKANDLARTKACRAKVLKRIDYPNNLDLYEFCDPSLREILDIGRIDETTNAPSETRNNDDGNGADDGDGGDGNDDNCQITESVADGTYELRAVITHRGRTVEEGHYICWNWHKDHWIKLDDDKSSQIPKNAIDLQGGLADGHVPYILLYERKGLFIN